jgi:hypothetical protein
MHSRTSLLARSTPQTGEAEQALRCDLDDYADTSSPAPDAGARRKLSAVATGGAGFLGSHLCEPPAVEGHQLICVDNFHSGRRANMRAQALLDWSLKVELAEGLHATIAYLDQELRRGERRRTDVHPRKVAFHCRVRFQGR